MRSPTGRTATRSPRLVCLAAVAWMGCVSTVFGTAVVSFELGASSRPGVFYSPSYLHGGPGPDLIRVKFDRDVRVSFYDLELRVVSAIGYSLPIEGFSYDAASHVAVWRIDGLGSSTNDRFLAVVSGVTDTSGHPLDSGPYTNSYTVLTGDVNSDDVISAADVLRIITALNNGDPYDPHLDVNFDGAVTPLDTLLVINEINTFAPPLVPDGPYRTVPMVPPAPKQITYFSCGKEINMTISGIPPQARISIEQSDILPATNWQVISTFFPTSAVTNLVLPRDWTKQASFYRAKFE